MNITPLFCPSCRADTVEKIDKIPETNLFSGVVHDASIIVSDLYKCSSCYLYFRYPQLDKAALDDLYKKTPEYHWQSQVEKRTDWKIALDWIRGDRESGAVLDVGCFDGEFLKQFGPSYQCSGVEINQKAARLAQQDGIILAASDIGDISKSSQKYDVITAFDVIEHVRDPHAFLKTLLSRLKPGSSLVISTGNTQALTWRLMGSRYWYCANPEHISFINPDWCRHVAQSLDLTIVRQEFFAHSSDGAARKVADFAKNLLYYISPKSVAALRKYALGKSGIVGMNASPPSWATARDHFITEFRKPL